MLTKIETVSSSCAGVMQAKWDFETTIPETISSPNLHKASALSMKLAPVTVTCDPPLTGPLCGDTAEIDGNGENVKIFSETEESKSTPFADNLTVTVF
jgi:hypothetical protein